MPSLRPGPLAYLWLRQAVFSLAFAAALAAAHEPGWAVLPLHLGWAALGLLLAQALAHGLARWGSARGWAEARLDRVSALPFHALLLASAALSLGSWVAWSAWGSALTWDSAVRFAPGLWARRGQTLLPTGWVLGLGALAALGAAAVLLERVRGLGRALAPGLARRVKVAWALAAAAWLLFFNLSYSPWDKNLWSGEPIADLRRWTFVPQDPARMQVSLADRLAREAYRPARPARPLNLVLVVVDALRPDRLGAAGYARETTPFLSGLKRQGRLAVLPPLMALCPETSCGMMALLGSRHWPDIAYGNFQLHQALQAAGWQTHFVISSDQDWKDLRGLYGDGIDSWWDSELDSNYESDDEHALRGLEALRPDLGRPQFVYLHLMSAHDWGVKKPAFRRWTPALIEADHQRYLRGGYRAELAGNRYDNGVLQADAMIGRAWDILRAKGLDPARTLWVVTSDHGEGLGEAGFYGHTFALHQPLLETPLLWADPEGRAPAVKGLRIQQDLAPTLLRRLGLPPPSHWVGQDLARPVAGRISFHSTRWPRPQHAALLERGGRRYKYLRDDGAPDGRRERLWSLDQDPLGERPEDLQDPALWVLLRARVAEHYGLELLPQPVPTPPPAP